MRSDGFADPGAAGDPADDPPRAVPVNTVAIGSQEDRSFAAFTDKARARTPNVPFCACGPLDSATLIAA
jgi:hypothetical protein